MKVLLASKLAYFPALSGAGKGDRCILEGLATRGHRCRIVMPARVATGQAAASAVGAGPLRAELARRGIEVRDDAPGTCRFDVDGVEYVGVLDSHRLGAVLADQIRMFEPARVIVSEDRSADCLATALDLVADRVVYLCHSQASLPCGPEAFTTDTSFTAMLQRAAGIVTISRYVQTYLRRWAGVEAVVMVPPVFGRAPFARHGRFGTGYVTLVNPSQIKGLEIFRQMAEARPDVAFAAVPTWSTRSADLLVLRGLPNVRLIEPSENIDDILAQMQMLLMPSLWGEAFGYLSVEAMLRGIPVLASAVGGLPEAKLGIDYLLPVQAIERYEKRLDERLLPIPIVPPQDPAPWLAALDALRSDRGHHERIAAASREAAHAFVAGVDIANFERYLERLGTEPKPGSEDPLPPAGDRRLSPERLALLNLMLRKRR